MLTTIISFIVVLGILIFFHELGHFMVAKYVGVQVEEFAIGMGPKLISKQKGETLYSLRALPLGGFCKMTGEMPIDEDTDEEELKLYEQAVKEEKTLFQKSILERFGVLSMGSIMNFLLGVLLFALIFMFFGVPTGQSDSTVIGQVYPQAPAYEAGLRDQDKIIAIDGVELDNWENVVSIIHQSPEQELLLEIERDGEILEYRVTPEYDESIDNAMIGITPVLYRERINPISALIRGVMQTLMFIFGILHAFGQMITGQMAAEVAGPVGIASMIGDSARSGSLRLMEFTALISINLGVINLLPLPALDGGRLVFLLIEAVRGKPVDPEKEGLVHLVGMGVLLLLMVVIVFFDIQRIFS